MLKFKKQAESMALNLGGFRPLSQKLTGPADSSDCVNKASGSGEEAIRAPEKYRDLKICFYREIKGLGRLYVLSQ